MFGLIHRQIGATQQQFGTVAILRIERDADTGGNANRPAMPLNRPPDRLDDALCSLREPVDILLAFPAILIGLAVAAIMGSGLTAVIVALVVSTVPDVARVARGAAVGVMGQEFMEAGRAVGLSNRALIWRYLTLNCVSTIAVFMTLRFGQVILVGSALGFLGMGAQPPEAELGMMAAQGRDFLFMAPHIATIPSLAIFAIVLTANLLGDAVRDVLDPRLQQ